MVGPDTRHRGRGRGHASKVPFHRLEQCKKQVKDVVGPSTWSDLQIETALRSTNFDVNAAVAGLYDGSFRIGEDTWKQVDSSKPKPKRGGSTTRGGRGGPAGRGGRGGARTNSRDPKPQGKGRGNGREQRDNQRDTQRDSNGPSTTGAAPQLAGKWGQGRPNVGPAPGQQQQQQQQRQPAAPRAAKPQPQAPAAAQPTLQGYWGDRAAKADGQPGKPESAAPAPESQAAPQPTTVPAPEPSKNAWGQGAPGQKGKGGKGDKGQGAQQNAAPQQQAQPPPAGDNKKAKKQQKPKGNAQQQQPQQQAAAPGSPVRSAGGSVPASPLHQGKVGDAPPSPLHHAVSLPQGMQNQYPNIQFGSFGESDSAPSSPVKQASSAPDATADANAGGAVAPANAAAEQANRNGPSGNQQNQHQQQHHHQNNNNNQHNNNNNNNNNNNQGGRKGRRNKKGGNNNHHNNNNGHNQHQNMDGQTDYMTEQMAGLNPAGGNTSQLAAAYGQGYGVQAPFGTPAPFVMPGMYGAPPAGFDGSDASRPQGMYYDPSFQAPQQYGRESPNPSNQQAGGQAPNATHDQNAPAAYQNPTVNGGDKDQSGQNPMSGYPNMVPGYNPMYAYAAPYMGQYGAFQQNATGQQQFGAPPFQNLNKFPPNNMYNQQGGNTGNGNAYGDSNTSQQQQGNTSTTGANGNASNTGGYGAQQQPGNLPFPGGYDSNAANSTQNNTYQNNFLAGMPSGTDAQQPQGNKKSKNDAPAASDYGQTYYDRANTQGAANGGSKTNNSNSSYQQNQPDFGGYAQQNSFYNMNQGYNPQLNQNNFGMHAFPMAPQYPPQQGGQQANGGRKSQNQNWQQQQQQQQQQQNY